MELGAGAGNTGPVQGRGLVLHRDWGTTVYHLADLAAPGFRRGAHCLTTACSGAAGRLIGGQGEHGVIVGSPLQQRALSRRYDEEVRRGARWLSPQRRQQLLDLYTLLDECGMGIAEMGLRFVLSNPEISCTLMGARSVAEVEQNIASAEKGPLPPELLGRLEQIVARVPFRPCEEPAVLPFGRQYRGPGGVR